MSTVVGILTIGQALLRAHVQGKLIVSFVSSLALRLRAFTSSFGKGPYYVKFVLNIPGQEDRTEEPFFVVEVSSRKQLPHSSFTFLSLVESTFYDGASLGSAGAGTLHVGLPRTEAAALKALGFSAGRAMSYAEESPTLPCGPLSVGFVDRGPALLLHTLVVEAEAGGDGRSQTTCFGRVVRGEEWLPTVESSILGYGRSVEILRVEHLRWDEEEPVTPSVGEL